MIALHQATISSGQTTSTPIKLDPVTVPVGIAWPAAFDGSGVTMEVSFDGATWWPIYDQNGVPVVVMVVPSKLTALDTAVLYSVRFFRVNAISAQSANRTLLIPVEKVS